LQTVRGSGVPTSVVCVRSYESACHFLHRTGDFVGRVGGDPCLVVIETAEPDDHTQGYVELLRKNRTPLPAVVLCDACPQERMRRLYEIGTNSILVMPAEMEQYKDWLVTTLQYWIRLNCTRIMLT